MSIPDYQSLMLPLLRLVADKREHLSREVADALADDFGLTDEDRSILLPSGNQPVFANRFGWARTYLKKAGLIEYPRRGVYRITDRGLDLLKDAPAKITARFLRQFPEFVSVIEGEAADVPEAGLPHLELEQTPQEVLEVAYARLNAQLEAEVLDTVKKSAPGFFERLVVDLLVRMGYGGSREDAGRAVGRSGDGGIDGIIKEDRLGLDAVHVQAKRWEGTVGRPEIQKFAGALQGHRARKGVFITTSGFSRDAEEYTRSIESKIVLIDGAMLAKLMIEHNIGVSIVGAYAIKKIDSDYFVDE